jgi:hypothetical protein
MKTMQKVKDFLSGYLSAEEFDLDIIATELLRLLKIHE